MSIAPILKRELKAYFTSPLIYAVVSVFLIISGYFFYTNLVMCVLFAGSGVSLDLWEYLLNDISYVLLLLLPLISMRLFAEEKKLGTIELLVTNPLKDTDILLGKYLAGLIVISLMLLLTGLYPLLVAIIHVVPVPLLLIGYTGLFLLAACFLACGTFLSSLTENQIIAAVSTAGLLILFWFMDRSGDFAGKYGAGIIKQLSLFHHYFRFGRGVIDTRDLIYFISIITACMLLTFLSLQSRHWKGMFIKPVNTRSAWRVGIILLLIIALVPLNVLATAYSQRIDGTLDKKHTLSHSLQEALRTVTHTMHITIQGAKEQRGVVEDYLDLLQTGCPHIRYTFMDVDKSPELAALKKVGDNTGFVEYQGRHEILATLNEKDLLKTIYVLTRNQKKLIGFTAKHGERALANTAADGFSAVQTALQAENFTIQQLSLDENHDTVANNLVVISAGPKQDFSDKELSTLGNDFIQGGRILLLLDGAALPRLQRFLKQYNVEVGTDIVVDRSNHLSDVDDLSPIVFINREHPIGSKLSSAVLFPRTSSVQVGTEPSAGFSWEILAQSGKETWAERAVQTAFDKTADFHEATDVRGPVQVSVIVKKSADKEHKAPEGRMVVVGTSLFALNQYFSVLGNKDFFLNIVRWLSEAPAPEIAHSIPNRPDVPPLVSLTLTESRIVFWSCLIIQPLIIFCIGTGVMLWRRYAC
jgi:ABC-2 type transport system permease protein